MVIRLAEAARRGNAGEHDTGEGLRRLTAPGTFFVVAEHDDGEIIGVAAGMAGRRGGGTGAVIPGLCHVSMVAVLPAHWGRGLGRELVGLLIARVREHGYDRAQLFTHTDNVRAQALYEGLGFRRTGRTAVSADGGDIVHYLLDPLPATGVSSGSPLSSR